ncbi:MAG TPA: MgtC/SapB family protein [Candidatus Limnocylindria bacterium]|nr:MgtC/SapB family protein [Candidatus Limnocylindria bacterium]
MTPDLSLATQFDLAGRLVVGLLLGAAIGFERELRGHSAGLRTHALVSLGAALFTVISAYGFSGEAVDPTRIAAQIVSGIGFIGAGTILQHRGSVRGLTTAASLWSVAAIGMAAGAGLLGMAVIGTVLILVVLSVLDWVEAVAARWVKPREAGAPPGHDRPSDHAG